MKFWFFWFVSIWFYASAVFASVTDDLNGKSPHEILFRAHLRKVADLNLRDRYNPTIFVSYSWDSEEYKRRIQTVCEDLEKAGILVNQILLDQWANRPGGPYDLHQFMERIPYSDIVMLFGTPELKRKYEEREAHPEDAGIVSHEINLLRNRVVAKGVKGVMNAWFDGEFYDSFPQGLHHIIGRKLDDYSLKFFELLWDLYQTIDPHPRNSIMEIKGNFAIRRERLRATSNQTEFQSANGFFPHSLIAHNAFLDRTNRRGLSYLDVIFEELFMNEDDRHFSTLTLCARANPQEVTLSGLGGVGKTTLATEFAHKYGMFYDLVYWITGGSREELLRSYLSLLKLLEIPIPEQRGERDENYSARIVRLINENLPKYHKHYLLVVDNIEDPALVADLSPPQGHVLYTSRNNDWMRQLDIDVLKREESIALLLQLTGLDPSLSEQADILAEELGDLPLALAQAAAYIRQQLIPTTFEDYLEIYRTSQAVLLSRRQIQASLNGKYGREAIVMTTWNATMQKLSEKFPKTEQLMSYFAYLASDMIPAALFYNDRQETVITALDKLDSYSMINLRNGYISLHNLVQSVNRLNQNNREIFGELSNIFLSFYDTNLNSSGQGDYIQPSRIALEIKRHIRKAFGYWKEGIRPEQGDLNTGTTLKGLDSVYDLFAQNIYHARQRLPEAEEKIYIQLITGLTDPKYDDAKSMADQYFLEIMQQGFLLDHSQIIWGISRLILEQNHGICRSAKKLFLLDMKGKDCKDLIQSVARLPYDSKDIIIDEALPILERSSEGWARGCSVEALSVLSPEKRACMIKLLHPVFVSGNFEEKHLGILFEIATKLSQQEINNFIAKLRPVLLANIHHRWRIEDVRRIAGLLSSLPPFLSIVPLLQEIFATLAQGDYQLTARANVLRDIVLSNQRDLSILPTAQALLFEGMNEWDSSAIQTDLSRIESHEEKNEFITITKDFVVESSLSEDRVLLVQALIGVRPDLRRVIYPLMRQIDISEYMTEKSKAQLIRSLSPLSSQEQIVIVVNIASRLINGRLINPNDCVQVFEAISKQARDIVL